MRRTVRPNGRKWIRNEKKKKKKKKQQENPPKTRKKPTRTRIEVRESP